MANISSSSCYVLTVGFVFDFVIVDVAKNLKIVDLKSLFFKSTLENGPAFWIFSAEPFDESKNTAPCKLNELKLESLRISQR